MAGEETIAALYYVWRQYLHVMPALVAGIHDFLPHVELRRGWPATSPVMTAELAQRTLREVL